MTEKGPSARSGGYVPRLKDAYKNVVVAEMMQRHGYANPFAVPRLRNIVVNMGVSEGKDNVQVFDAARGELGVITGQLPRICRAKKSISNFKLREGMPIGLKVTLRGDRMYEFLDHLISMAIPRIRDFRGLDAAGFDGHGNFNLGIREHHIFPEVNLEKSPKARGMNISFVTSGADASSAKELLQLLGMPFKKPKDKDDRDD